MFQLHRPPADVLLRARHRAFASALAARDPTQCARFYTDGAVLVPPDGPIVSGRTAIVAWLGAAFEKEGPVLHGDVSDFVLAGGEAYVTGRFTRRSSGGGKYTEVWRSVDGQWRIAYQMLAAGGR